MGELKLVNIGYGNSVLANRIVAIVSMDSAPIKRIVQETRDSGMLIDATYGRRTRAVIITDSRHVILSSIQPETIANRIIAKESMENEGTPDHAETDRDFISEELADDGIFEE